MTKSRALWRVPLVLTVHNAEGEHARMDGTRAREEWVLEETRRRLGEEHPETLSAMNGLAGTLRLQAESQRALPVEPPVAPPVEKQAPKRSVLGGLWASLRAALSRSPKK